MSTKDSRSDAEKAAEVDRILEDAGITEDDSDQGETVTVVAPLRRDRKQS
jgi:hypothetical protein